MFAKAAATVCYGVLAVGPGIAAHLQQSGQPELATAVGAVTTLAGVVLHFLSRPFAAKV